LVNRFSVVSGYDKTGGADCGTARRNVKRSKSDTSEKQERSDKQNFYLTDKAPVLLFLVFFIALLSKCGSLNIGRCSFLGGGIFVLMNLPAYNSTAVSPRDKVSVEH